MTIESVRQNLSHAVTTGDLESVKQIVLSNPMSARWSSTDQIPLLTLAVQCGYLDIAKFLIENKARLNWVSPNGDETLYSMAKRLGHGAIAEYLKPLMDSDLQKVVDDKARQNQSAIGETALALESDSLVDDYKIFEKIQNNDIESIQQILLGGVDVNIRFEDDITPLIAAAGQGNPEIVKILVKAGADVNALDADFESALLAAKTRGFNEIENYLLPITSNEIKAMIDEQMAV